MERDRDRGPMEVQKEGRDTGRVTGRRRRVMEKKNKRTFRSDSFLGQQFEKWNRPEGRMDGVLVQFVYVAFSRQGGCACGAYLQFLFASFPPPPFSFCFSCIILDIPPPSPPSSEGGVCAGSLDLSFDGSCPGEIKSNVFFKYFIVISQT